MPVRPCGADMAGDGVYGGEPLPGAGEGLGLPAQHAVHQTVVRGQHVAVHLERAVVKIAQVCDSSVHLLGSLEQLPGEAVRVQAVVQTVKPEQGGVNEYSQCSMLGADLWSRVTAPVTSMNTL